MVLPVRQDLSDAAPGAGHAAQPSHVCRCRSNVDTQGPQGAAAWSYSPVVATKLARAFGNPDAAGAVRIVGEGWPERLRDFAGALSPIERATVRACSVDVAGEVDAWRATPIETFLHRQSTPWLPRVLNDGLLTTHYQPIVDVASGRTIGYEALARAELDGVHYGGGQLVDAARAHDALFQFDQQARTTAIRDGGDRLRAGELLFINFIPMVIYDPAVCLRTTWEAARAAGWQMDKLVFEVVESERFPDIGHLRAILDAYRDQGCGVALDDLGTGHTALSFIDELRPDVIKLAKGLMPERPRPHELALVRGLVEHARNKGITTLIEGVETPEQLDAARELEIDLVQGYLLGKPAAEPVRATAPPARRAA